MSLAHPASKPARFAGFTLDRWAFGLRIWVAMMLALYVAFWLQLSGASSAATCVGILALPTRGQALAKAFYRSLATVVGVTASIAISGLFAQTRDLFIVACAGWIGVCVLGANLLDGSRAYGIVLSGYTVAIVSVMQIDTPSEVFSSGVNRGAAIAVGILSITVVSDLFGAPAIYPELLGKVKKVRRKTRDFAIDVLHSGDDRPFEAADLMKEITALHPDLEAVASELPDGGTRAAAARGAIAAMLNMIGAARNVVRAEPGVGSEPGSTLRTGLASALAGDDPGLRDEASRDWLETDQRAGRAAVRSRASDLLAQDALAASSLRDMEKSRAPKRDVHLPVYRSFHAAAYRGAKVGVAIALSSIVFVLSSWPSTSSALSALAILGALSANSPNPKGFVQGLLLATPIMVVVVGITEFLVLNGVDQFPLLCIAMGPTILASCLLLTSPDAKFKGLGFITLLLLPVLLSPSNPQSYNAQSYLVTCTMVVAGVLTLAFWLTALPSSSAAMKRRWYLRSAARDLRLAIMGRSRHRTEGAALFRSADRIGQLAGLSTRDDAAQAVALHHALLLHDVLAAVLRARTALDALAAHFAPPGLVTEGRTALEALDGTALRRAADRVEHAGRDSSGPGRTAACNAAAEFAFLSSLVETAAGASGGHAADLV